VAWFKFAVASCGEKLPEMHRKYNHAEPLLPTEFPERPWQKVALDLFELNGQMYLLVIDNFSRCIEIAKLFNTSSQSVINHLKSIFARHGIPECFMSDREPQYVSFVFKQFAQSYGFQHIVSSPRYAQSNGLAERGVQTIKMMLKTSDDPYIALLGYRATPLANGHSPAELLMGRKLQYLLQIAPNQLKPKLPSFRSLRENEKQSKLTKT
jgi:transposase InsO family protein